MLKEMQASPVPKKRWLQMGAELEGSWKSRKTTATLCRGARAHEDRSVHIGHGDPGEIVTRPHDNLEDLLFDIKTLWPDTVNESCGFHLHASFTPLDGCVIATKDFYKWFKSEWAKWGKEQKLDPTHEFWNRLAGRNKFAKDVFDPDVQLKGMMGAPPNDRRYTILNFFAWEKHKTIECRLLPMFTDVNVALSATIKLSQIYNDYLNANEMPKIVLEPNVQVIGDCVEETHNMVQPPTAPWNYEAESTFVPVPGGEDVYYSIQGAEHLMLPFRKELKDTTP